MLRIVCSAIIVGAVVSSAASAQERIELNFIYPLNQETFQLNDGVYFTQDNLGYSEVVEGPLEGGAVRCMGSGFAGGGVNSVEGICIIGEGENTFTIRWAPGDMGLSNDWSVVAGTGTFDGASGEGVATSGAEILFRAMPLRQTHLVGTITLP
ncbi:hypothetical protein [Gymnodinialimonas sp.]